MNEQDSIRAFWEWFSSVCAGFGNKLENNCLIRELDNQIRRIGPVCWEIGPGFKDDDANSLVISPGGNKSLLYLTREIVANAPPCKGWEFYPFKPPKKWQRRFSVTDEKGNTYRVDASGWTYVLLRYPDGAIEVIIEAPETRTLPLELHDTVGEILIDGEIGEARRIETIENIQCVQILDEEYKPKSKPIELFAGHLKHILSKSEATESSNDTDS